jgi:hypothetical protein
MFYAENCPDILQKLTNKSGLCIMTGMIPVVSMVPLYNDWYDSSGQYGSFVT